MHQTHPLFLFQWFLQDVFLSDIPNLAYILITA